MNIKIFQIMHQILVTNLTFDKRCIWLSTVDYRGLSLIFEYVEKWTNLSMTSPIGTIKSSLTDLVNCTRYNRAASFSLSKEYTRWLSRTTRSFLLMPVSHANYMKYLVIPQILQCIYILKWMYIHNWGSFKDRILMHFSIPPTAKQRNKYKKKIPTTQS